MQKRVKTGLLLGLTAAMCVLLCACDAKIDESIFDTHADTSVNIKLPYVTVTPPPAVKDETQALEISANGTVTVNDTAILNESAAGTGVESKYKSLRLGNTGFAVQVLQNRLTELGYLSSGVTGIFDDETETAVRRFEQAYGTMQTGVATAAMQERLFSDNAYVYASEAYNEAVVSQYRILRRGDAGSAVYALQQRLMNLGYPITKLSGTFDAETAAAVELFYQAYGLTPSDVANVALQREIYSDSARPYGGNAPSADAEAAANTVEIQARLHALGYLGDNATEEQLQLGQRLFQQACGELPSSTMSARVLSLLFADSAPTFASAYSQYENLIEGASGDMVTRLQSRLIELGFALGTPNGVYGESTSTSIRLFQAANGLEETGAATAYTQAVLFSTFARNIDGEYAISANAPADEIVVDAQKSAPAETTVADILSNGSSGDDVLKLQNRLTELGYISSVTGEYDALTGRGVATFQETIGMETNGVADSALLKFLYSNAAPYFGANFYEEPQSFQTLAEGSSGEMVTNLQKRLWKMGYLPTDGVKNSVGVYNGATAQAVYELQSAIGYDAPDGVASPEIQCFLFCPASNAYAK